MTVDLDDIPTRGLLEALSGWALAGAMTTVEALTIAMGSLPSLDATTAWTPEDVGRRADRMAWEHLRPAVMSLPETSEQWIDALPAMGVSHTEWSDVPRSPVDWGASVRRMGAWPPPPTGQVVYLTRHRSRQRDESTTATMAWGREQLLAIIAAAENMGATVPPRARDRIEAVPAVAPPVQPDYAELEALRLLGTPFTELSSAIATVLELYSDPFVYARELLLPDDDLRWRLFHLGCYGELLGEAVDRIGPITSTRPLLAGTSRANHVLTDGADTGVTYEFWFEASGLWGLKPEPTSHTEVAKAVRGTRGGLVPDVAAVRHRNGVAEQLGLTEVKYSRNGQYIFGAGYAQAIGYGVEAVQHFKIDTLSLVLAPSDMLLSEVASVERGVSGARLRTGAATPAGAAGAIIDWLTT